MIKHLKLFLFIGLALGQAESDTLILKDGSNFSGKFLDIIFGKIIFEIADKSVVKHPVKSIQKLSINTFMIISNGQWVVPKEFIKYSRGKINQQKYDNYNTAWVQSESDTSQIDYYELGVIAAKQDFNSLPYWGLGLCSPGNPLLAFAIVVIFPINIDEKHKLMIETKSGHNFISGYEKEITDLRFKSVVKGCGITLITAATAFLLFFDGVPLH